MSNDKALTVAAERQAYIAEMKSEIMALNWDDIKDHYAPNASGKEFAIFLDTCQANVLDPRKKECYFVKYGTAKGQVITGYQTYIKRAERTGQLNGWDVKTVKADGKVLAAIITIYRKDFDKPFVWEVDMDEFNKGQSTWNSMPSFMLKKVAIAQGFRLAFPDEVGGLPYTSEEASTFVDENTAKAALEKTNSGKTRAIDMTGDAEAEAAAKVKDKAKAKAKADADAKAKAKADATASTTEEVVDPKVLPPSTAALLSDGTKGTIISSFEQFAIKRELIESIVGTTYEEWNEDHREWLVQQWHLCDEGGLDATKFAALSYE